MANPLINSIVALYCLSRSTASLVRLVLGMLGGIQLIYYCEVYGW
jgi:hypothetical protein